MATRKNQKGKLSGLNADGTPNAHWRKFKARLDAYEDTQVQNWADEHVLAHIIRRYKDLFGIEFALSYCGAPSKCREIYCVRRALLALGTDDKVIAKKYVDWVFDTIIIPHNITVSSIAYFFTDALIRGFKQEFRKTSKLTRATRLPENYLSIAASLSINVNTYGDLAFAKQAIDDNPKSQAMQVYCKLFDALKSVGFDEKILSVVEG